jgi:multidrug efflux pump subunit AcrA (membrane-fusion protein)
VLGASLSPGDELYRVVANASRVVFVHVPEAKIAEVDLGARVTVRPREAAVGLAEPCVGTAERAATLVDEDRTVRVRVRLEDGCALKLAGRSLTVGLPLTSAGASSPAAVVPVAAVVELRGKHVVFVQGRDRLTFSWRAVRLGSTVGERVVVEDGVQPGERVVVRGTVLLKGEIVRAEPIE